MTDWTWNAIRSIHTDTNPPEERTFDRLPSTNPLRLQRYPFAATPLADRPLRSYSWRYVQTNQGREGACVGHATTGEAAARPKPVFGDPVHQPPDVATVNGVAHDVYKAAQLIDEFPQTPGVEGTSVDAGMRIGHDRGWWREYRWAETAREVALAVGYNGPVVAGGWWRTGMDKPDADGTMHYTGAKRGGHSFLWTRYSKTRDALWTPNSWGGAGQGWLTLEDVDRFLADQGEAAIPMFRHL